MIIITPAPGGLYLRRDDSDAAPLFVADDEIAAAIADLVARAAPVAAWDTYAYLCGNDEAAVPA